MTIKSNFLLIVIFLFLITVALVRAVVPTGVPFGGPILTSTICDTGIWITVGPPAPGSFMIMPPPATVIFPYGIFRPGAFVLGSFIPSPPITCFIGPVPVGGGILANMIGTSL